MEKHKESLTVYEIGDLEVFLGTHSIVGLDDQVVFPEPESLVLLRFFPEGTSADSDSPSVTLTQFRNRLIAQVLIPNTVLKWPVAQELGRCDVVAKLHTRFRTFALYQEEDYATEVEVEIEVYNRGEFHANVFCETGVIYRKLTEDYRILAEIAKITPPRFET